MKTFDVTLRFDSGISNLKIAAIKAVRAATGCGLKEAKDAVEASCNPSVAKLRLTGDQVALLVIAVTDENDRRRHDFAVNYAKLEIERLTAVQSNFADLTKYAA